MKQKSRSTIFTFVLDNQRTMNNIDHIKMQDYQQFKQINQIGAMLQAAAKDDDCKRIAEIAELNHTLLPFLKLEIQDAFVSALNLRNITTLQYFLSNGFQINSVAEDAALSVCYSLEYLKGQEAPLDLLILVLSFGANARKASDRDSQTAMHVAAQYGQISFLKQLLQYGADINAVSDERQTPLGVALKHKRVKAAEYLKDKGASQRWDI